MTHTVHKYPLDVVDLQTVDMPAGATILTVQVQHDTIALWARVDTARFVEQRVIFLVGTGNPLLEHAGRYIATVQLHGSLAFHAFEG